MTKIEEVKRALDITDEVISAIEAALGITNVKTEIESRAISYTPGEKDFTKLQKLYKNPEAKPLIDKFIEACSHGNEAAKRIELGLG